jgi:hypothetical protein
MRIFADTNVLFPFSVMDLLLALTEDEVHEFVWRPLNSWNGSARPHHSLPTWLGRICDRREDERGRYVACTS